MLQKGCLTKVAKCGWQWSPNLKRCRIVRRAFDPGMKREECRCLGANGLCNKSRQTCMTRAAKTGFMQDSLAAALVPRSLRHGSRIFS